jgi:hypothetical protein
MTGYACPILGGTNSSPNVRKMCAVLMPKDKLQRSGTSTHELRKKSGLELDKQVGPNVVAYSQVPSCRMVTGMGRDRVEIDNLSERDST